MKRLDLVLLVALAIAAYGCGSEGGGGGNAGSSGTGGSAGTGGSSGTGGTAATGGSSGTGGTSGCIPETDDVNFVVPAQALTETPAVCFQRLGVGFGGSLYSLFPASPCPTGVVYLEWGSDMGGPLLLAGAWVAPNGSSVPVQILSTSAGVLDGTTAVRGLPFEADVTISTCELDAMTFRIDPNSLTITEATPR